jgi:hypothetical protein
VATAREPAGTRGDNPLAEIDIRAFRPAAYSRRREMHPNSFCCFLSAIGPREKMHGIQEFPSYSSDLTRQPVAGIRP